MDIELPFGVFLPETVFYIVVAMICLVIFAIIILILLKRSRAMTTIEKEGVYDYISKLTRQKARLKAKNLALEQAWKSGKISGSEHTNQVAKNKREVDRLDKEIDGMVYGLAKAYLPITLKREKALDKKKLEYVLELQKGQKGMQEELFKLQGEMDRVLKERELLSMENESLKSNLDVIEEKYKERVITLEVKLDEARKGKPNQVLEEEAPEELEGVIEKTKKLQDKVEDYYHRNQLYKLLVSRYADFITSNESKTIEDMREAIQPRNTHVVRIADEIKSRIKDYDPKKDLLEACEDGYEYILNEVHSVPSLGVDFWMSIKEVLDNKVADYEDKAILLCSVFKSLGANARVLITTLTDGSSRPFVVLKTKKYEILCDPNEKHEFQEYVGPRDKIIKQYKIDDAKISRVLYEFDDKEYVEY